MIRDADHQPQSVEGLATEEEKPTKFWLATVPENVAFDASSRSR